MKTLIALLTAGALVIGGNKWNRGQHYCYNATRSSPSEMFPTTQAYCYSNLPLCMRGADRSREAGGQEVSSCQSTNRLYCLTVHGNRWCSTDQYLCSETAQHFGIDSGCNVSNIR